MAEKYGPKKMLPVYILEILKKHSDGSHPITQNKVHQYLEDEYQMSIERKAISRTLKELKDLGYVDVSGKPINRNGSELLSKIYYDQIFEPSIVQLLIDSVVFSNHIPETHRKEIIEKIKSELVSEHFNYSTANIEVINSSTSQNTQLFQYLEDIQKPIKEKKKIRFVYNDYIYDDVSKTVQLKEKGAHIASPNKIVAKNNHYYLIVKEKHFENLTHYRLDRITHLEILDEGADPISHINTPVNEYLASRPYMLSGKTETIRLRIDREILSDVIDWFGDILRVENSDDSMLVIRLSANPDDLFYWALQYGKYVEVLAPQDLRNRIRETVEVMKGTYLSTKEDRRGKVESLANKRGWLELSDSIHYADLNIDPHVITKCFIAVSDNPDISFLSDFSNLTTLDLLGARTKEFPDPCPDLFVLNLLSNLKSLHIRNIGLSDFSPISELPLKILDIDEERKIEHLDLLCNMDTLELLSIHYNLAQSIDIEHLKEINPKLRIHIYPQRID